MHPTDIICIESEVIIMSENNFENVIEVFETTDKNEVDNMLCNDCLSITSSPFLNLFLNSHFLEIY